MNDVNRSSHFAQKGIYHCRVRTVGKLAIILAIMMFLAIHIVYETVYTKYDLSMLEETYFCSYTYKNDETIIYKCCPNSGETVEAGRLEGKFYRGVMSEDGTYIIGALRTKDASLEIAQYYLEDGRVLVCLDEKEIEEILGEETEQSRNGYNVRLQETGVRYLLTHNFVLYDLDHEVKTDLSGAMAQVDISRHVAFTKDSIWGTNCRDELKRYDRNSGNAEVVMKNVEDDCVIFGDGKRIAQIINGNGSGIISLRLSSYDTNRTIRKGIACAWPDRSCYSSEMGWSGDGKYLFYTIRTGGFFGGWDTSIKAYSVKSGRTYTVFREFFKLNNRKISFVQASK